MAVIKENADSTEYEMFYEYRQTGDKKLRDEIVQNYIYIAEILSRKFVNRGIEYDDIFQVACLGVLYAVERFDPDRGVKFATFATPTVLGEIRRYFRDKGHFIKVPRKLYEIFCKAEKIRRANTGKNIPESELARILNLPESVINKAYLVGDAAFIKSLEYEAYADGSMNLGNFLAHDDGGFAMIENRDFLNRCLELLSDSEREFVRLRYYEEKSQREIAAVMGMSQMHISRMERKVLEHFKNHYFRD